MFPNRRSPQVRVWVAGRTVHPIPRARTWACRGPAALRVCPLGQKWQRPQNLAEVPTPEPSTRPTASGGLQPVLRQAPHSHCQDHRFCLPEQARSPPPLCTRATALPGTIVTSSHPDDSCCLVGSLAFRLSPLRAILDPRAHASSSGALTRCQVLSRTVQCVQRPCLGVPLTRSARSCGGNAGSWGIPGESAAKVPATLTGLHSRAGKHREHGGK